MVTVVGDDVRGARVELDHLARTEVEHPVDEDEAQPTRALADLVITPEFGSLGTFDSAHLDRAVKAGRASGEAVLPRLRAIVGA